MEEEIETLLVKVRPTRTFDRDVAAMRGELDAFAAGVAREGNVIGLAGAAW